MSPAEEANNGHLDVVRLLIEKGADATPATTVWSEEANTSVPFRDKSGAAKSLLNSPNLFEISKSICDVSLYPP